MLHEKKQLPLQVATQILLIAAIGMSLWLTVVKWTGKIDTLAGCGAGSGCEQVLGSRWSMAVAVLPVSLLAAVAYLAASVSVWKSGAPWPAIRLGLAATLVSAAAWFGGLQLFAVAQICRYCHVIHAIGVAAACGLVALDARHWLHLPSQATWPLAAGFGLTVWFAFIQVVGPIPATHRVESLRPRPRTTGPNRQLPADIHAMGEGRLVEFLNGQKAYRIGAVPLIGNANARHILVKYFDYKCDSCRTMHGQLEELMAKYPEEFAVIMIPAPLEHGCNRYLPKSVQNHPEACALARCALTVWRKDAAQFETFHHWLFDARPTATEARDRLEKLQLPDDDVTEWIDAFLRQDFKDYSRLIQRTVVMPKLLIHGTSVMQGVPRNLEALIETLRIALPSARIP